MSAKPNRGIPAQPSICCLIFLGKRKFWWDRRQNSPEIFLKNSAFFRGRIFWWVLHWHFFHENTLYTACNCWVKLYNRLFFGHFSSSCCFWSMFFINFFLCFFCLDFFIENTESSSFFFLESQESFSCPRKIHPVWWEHIFWSKIIPQFDVWQSRSKQSRLFVDRKHFDSTLRKQFLYFVVNRLKKTIICIVATIVTKIRIVHQLIKRCKCSA